MEYRLCGLCNGDGRIEYADSFTNEIDSEVCPKCQGTGKINLLPYTNKDYFRYMDEDKYDT